MRSSHGLQKWRTEHLIPLTFLLLVVLSRRVLEEQTTTTGDVTPRENLTGLSLWNKLSSFPLRTISDISIFWYWKWSDLLLSSFSSRFSMVCRYSVTPPQSASTCNWTPPSSACTVTKKLVLLVESHVSYGDIWYWFELWTSTCILILKSFGRSLLTLLRWLVPSLYLQQWPARWGPGYQAHSHINNHQICSLSELVDGLIRSRSGLLM
jgi:hypothetical protein